MPNFDAMPTLGDIPRYYAIERPHQAAIVFEGRTTSWRALDSGANRVANALLESAVPAGSRIGYCGKSSDEFFELLFGAAKAGAVLVPVQWRLALAEIEQIVRDADLRYLFLGTDQLDKLAALRAVMADDIRVVTMEHGSAELPCYPQWRDAAPDTDPALCVNVASAALQLYTSGTTGLPKGVMLSHDNLLRGRRDSLRVVLPWNEWLESDVNLVAMPVGHIGGVGWAIVGLLNGVTSIVHREFAPAQVLEAIEHHHVSKLFLVPTALHMLLQQPRVRQIDYSRLRYILYGASPIAVDLLREATEVFGCGFCQQYGMTETAGTIVYLPPQDHAAGNPRMRAAGIPMPGVEVRVVDAQTRQRLPPTQVGEVETRSVSNMLGYCKLPDATAATIDSEGWLRTGDAGHLDVDGYLYIHDRLKDMIISGGENIYPAEVENAVYGHPAVQEVAVIGVPDERWGEAVKAFVVLKPQVRVGSSDIIAFARTRIAGFKVPKSVDFVTALPRSPAGKILRRALREPYWSGRERQVN